MDALRPPVDPKRDHLQATPVVFELDDGCLPDYAVPGSFEMRLSEGQILIACPGCGRVSGMTIGNPKPAQSPSWLITGEANAPTLRPSINCVGCCAWHGFLSRGIFSLEKGEE